jgi:hypothetical protein
MLRLIQGGRVSGREEQPIALSASSDTPEMTPTLAKVFVGIFRRLLAEDRAAAGERERTRAA